MGRAKWLLKGDFGVMVHYIPVIAGRDGKVEPEWNECVGNFDVIALGEVLTEVNAGWLIMPFGQNHGPYLSENKELDKYLGGDYFTDRDLMSDIADELTSRDISLVAYLPTELWSHDFYVQENLGWNIDLSDKSVFMERWMEGLKYWGEKFGKKIKGWWFDGCYDAKEKGFIPSGKNQWNNTRFDQKCWTEAARAGNPERAFSMCQGANCMTYLWPEEDYLSGEAGELHAPPMDLPSGMRPHGLIWIDCFWGHNPENQDFKPEIPEPRFGVEEFADWVRSYRKSGGGCTINIGIYRDGTFPEKSVEFLKEVGALIRKKTL